VGAGRYHERGGLTGGLAQFDVADIGQSKNPLDLQLELARVHSPEPFAKTLTIAAIDLGHPLIDCPDVAAIVEVELRQCQEQRDHRAEKKDADEKAPSNAAEAARQRAPCRGDAPQRRRPAIGFAAVLAGVCRFKLQNSPLPRQARTIHVNTTAMRGSRQIETHTIA
jgi:hypothetical protein